MAAATYFQAVQEIYIAYYQRPADPAGLKYWAERVDAAGGDTTAIIDAFATSKEATSLYGDINQDGVGQVIDKIYQALFGRTPDEAGKAFYEAAFGDGTVSAGNIAIAILNAAREQDTTAIANKVAVANTFTQLIAGRELDDPAFGTDEEFSFDYAGNDAAAAARQLLANVTADPETVLDKEAVQGELEGENAGGDGGNAGGGGGTPSIPTFSVAEALEHAPLSGKYKLVDTLEHLELAEDALLENARSYSLTDPAGSLGTLTAEQIALVQGAANDHLYTYGEFFTLTELVGTAGDDTFTAPPGSLKTYKLIDGAGGDDVLNIVSSGNLTNFVPGSTVIRNIETVSFQNSNTVWGNINASRFEEGTAIWQHDFDVDVIGLGNGQTAGFGNTDGNILVSYADGAQAASIAIQGLASANGNSFVISGDDLTTLSVSGSMATEDAVLRLHAETGTGLNYVPTANIATLNLAITTDIELQLTGNFTSLVTLDASASTGDIFTILPVGANSPSSVLMGSGNDVVVQNGQEDMTIDLGAGDDRFITGVLQSGIITLGDGSDRVQFNNASGEHLGNIRLTAGETGNIEDDFEAQLISITDFDGTNDVLSFEEDSLQGGGYQLEEDQQNAISTAENLYEAILLADAATDAGNGTPQWTTFQYEGSTYIYQNNGDFAFGYAGAPSVADGLIQLLDFTGDLTEANFIVPQLLG